MTGMADVPDAVERIADVLAKQNIRHAFGGAIAQNFWGIVRATQDVDVLALIPSLQLPAVVEALIAAGFHLRDSRGLERAITVADLRESQRQRSLFAIWLGLVKVELFAPVLPLQHRMLDRARPMPWRQRTVPVTTAEDLILIKMVFHRDKDLRDVRAMIATSGTTLDRSYMQTQATDVLSPDQREELQRLLAAT